jgi:hypothetical protein
MHTQLSIAATVGLVLLLGQGTGVSQTPQQLAILKRLGPDGFAGAPPLDVLVDAAAAAVVGRVAGSGGFALREVDSPYSDQPGAFGYVRYRIAVDDVLFIRTGAGAPPLAKGTVVELEQRVGGDGALRFFNGQRPVVAGDTCLLFLEAEPHGVTLSGWSVQFRRAGGPTATGETLGGPALATAMATTRDWFGPSVRLVDTPGGPMPEWTSLLAEVRRLAAVDPSSEVWRRRRTPR